MTRSDREMFEERLSEMTAQEIAAAARWFTEQREAFMQSLRAVPTTSAKARKPVAKALTMADYRAAQRRVDEGIAARRRQAAASRAAETTASAPRDSSDVHNWRAAFARAARPTVIEIHTRS